MSTPSLQTPRSLVVALFERQPEAQQALEELRDQGVSNDRVAVLGPGEERIPSASPNEPDLLRMTATTTDAHDIADVLATLGVPDGEARFYADEARDGRTLIVVDAKGRSDTVRELLLGSGGYDVQSRGRDLARPSGAGVSGGTGPKPVDVTGRWEDVSSRYEMLWQQHYGTSDTTWEQMVPLYARAWQLANDPSYRGRPWSEVEPRIRQVWESDAAIARRYSWHDAEGPLRDVWEDVAEEAVMGAEGGADRIIPRQGTDQSVPARDLRPPA